MPALKHKTETVKEVLTVKDVAAALGLSPDRVYGLISEGELPSIRVGSKAGGVRVPRQAFETYLHEMNQAALASCRVSEFTEAFRQSGAAVQALLTPTPEQQAASREAREGFLMGIRNMNLPR